MPCPPADLLAAYADRALPGDASRDLEAHAAACPDCLDALRLLTDPRGRVAERPARRFPFLRAAAVLLAVSLSVLAWRAFRQELPGPGSTASLPSAAPGWPEASRVLPASGWASAGVDIVPQPWARLDLGRDGQGNPSVMLQAGGAWIRGSEALRLRTPMGPLSLAGVEAWVESASAAPSLSQLLLPEAAAGEGPSLRIVPLEGLLRWPGGEAGPGLAVFCSGTGITTSPVAPERLAALRQDRLQRLKDLGAWRDLLPSGSVLDAKAPAEDFSGSFPIRWRLLLRLERRNPATEVAILLPTPGGTRQWTVRLPSRSRAADSDLEVLSDGARFVARLDGRTLMDLPAAGMAGSLEAVPGKSSPGLRSWGGAVTASARLQELP